MSAPLFPRTLIAAAGFAAVAAFALPAAAGPLTTYYLHTGQTNAQTQIDEHHTSSWTFSLPVDAAFGGGDFTMKDGAHTSAHIVLTLYEGADASGPKLGEIDLTKSLFCSAHGGNCQTFAETPFHFTTPILLDKGVTYTATLTSPADDAQSEAYFIKGARSGGLEDANGNLPSAIGAAIVVGVPEPASIAAFGTALAALPALRRRRAGGR